MEGATTVKDMQCELCATILTCKAFPHMSPHSLTAILCHSTVGVIRTIEFICQQCSTVPRLCLSALCSDLKKSRQNMVFP